MLDSELTNLAIGEGFLRLSGYPIAKVRIAPPKAMDVIAPAFVPAHGTQRTSPPSTPPTGTPPLAAVRIEDRDDWLSMGGL